jgi:hypothetical protein
VITQVAAHFNLMNSHTARMEGERPPDRVLSAVPERMRSRETYVRHEAW